MADALMLKSSTLYCRQGSRPGQLPTEKDNGLAASR